MITDLIEEVLDLGIVLIGKLTNILNFVGFLSGIHHFLYHFKNQRLMFGYSADGIQLVAGSIGKFTCRKNLF